MGCLKIIRLLNVRCAFLFTMILTGYSTLLASGQAAGDRVCASCHQAIYDNYEKTSMARASGPAAGGLISGKYSHTLSGVDYTIAFESGAPVLRYERAKDPPLHGTTTLAYFVGSGKRGRTYLYGNDGYWFQAPIDWYAKRQIWDMAPGYSEVHAMPYTLAVDEGCLSCHASGGRRSEAGAVNHFGERPFDQAGITCARCHGDATAHLASKGRAPIVNPAKLTPVKRDSICQQCHLEGETTVRLAGKFANDFKPGEQLTDYVSYFVHDRQANPNVRAVSQVEAMSQSICKRRSGDAMTCTSCHDSHRTIAPEERISWYRAKCLTCHTGSKIAVDHHPENNDCTSCHMPRSETTDIAHEQATDHRILRKPDEGIDLEEPSSKLISIIGSKAEARELGLAYFSFAQKGDLFSKSEALRLLRQASVEQPKDGSVASALGQLFESQGEQAKAMEQFRRAYELEPTYPGAAVALGTGLDRSQAIPVWQRAYAKDPADSGLGLRLALAQCASGDQASAKLTLETVTRFNPDFRAAQRVLTRLSLGGDHLCTSDQGRLTSAK